MHRHLLKVDALRKRTLPGIDAPPKLLSDVIAEPGRHVLSRRKAIGIAGTVSLAAAPIARAMAGVLRREYSMVRRGPAIVFIVAGVERWVLDPRMFTGSPRVSLAERDDTLHVALEEAYYPGTTLRADIACSISRTGQAVARFTKDGETSAPVDFVPWLIDLDVAIIPRRGTAVFRCDEAEVRTHLEEIRFRPTWTMHLMGVSVLRTGTLELPSSGLDVTLLTQHRPTMFATRPARRSLLRIARGTHQWHVPLELQGLPEWRLSASDDAFDTLSLECSDDARVACLFEGRTDGGLTLLPTNVPAALPLRETRYAWVRTDEGVHEALVARYSRARQWWTLDGVSVEVGDRDEIPPLEITSVNGRVTRLNVAPGFHRYSVPVDGAIVEPTVMQHGSQLALVTSLVSARALPKAHFHMAALQIDAKGGVMKQIETTKQLPTTKARTKVRKQFGGLKPGAVALAGNPKITVIRPEDLLVLTFEFDGITLNKAAGTFAAGGNAKLIVHFQPQHIAERAFFYTQEKPNTDELSTKKNVPTGASDEPLLDPPIDAVLAHGSRVVFRVPSGYTGFLRVTPPGGAEPTSPSKMLLDWSAFTLHVSPSAKPPSTGLIFGSLAGAFTTKFSASFADKGYDVKPVRTIKTAGTPPTRSITRRSYKAPSYTLTVEGEQTPLTNYIKAQVDSQPDIMAAIPSPWMQEITAAVNEKPPIREPLADETAIEYPYRLIMSPNKYAGWAHKQGPAWGKDLADNPTRRVELWHTRLGVRHSDGRVNEDAAYLRTIRAIWSPDIGTQRTLDAKYMERPFRTSLNRRDRFELVRLMSDYAMATKTAPMEVRRFMMSSLGAWADMTGVWDPLGEDGLDVEQWIQRGSQGRDHFVRVCYKGYLFPFGHRATLVKETERKFRRTPRGDMAAYLMQRLYIILRQPQRDFPADGLEGQRYQGRDFPFRSVVITTRSTPNLNLPVKVNPGLSSNSFWPQFTTGAGTQDVRWTCIGTDWDGNQVQFSSPLAFIANTDATNDADLKTFIEGDYQTKTENRTRRAIKMGGQPIAFAPSTRKGDTTLPVETFTLNGYYSDTVPANTVRFFPVMQTSAARIEKVDELLGTQTPREVAFVKQFLDYAFDPGSEVKKAGQAINAANVRNPSQLFLKLLATADMDFGSSSDKAGGLAAPSIQIAGLSRLTGPVAGAISGVTNTLEDIAGSAAAAGSFDPMEYFGSILSTKILGDITLKDVLTFVSDILGNVDSMPGLDKKDEFGVKETQQEIKDFAQTVQSQVQGFSNDVAKEVLDAKQALVADAEAVKNEIQSYISAGKQAAEHEIKAWKRTLENRLGALKSEVDKAIKPLKDAGNEAYKKYEEAQGYLNSIAKGLQLVYEWQTEIKSSPGNILTPMPGKQAILALKTEMVKKLDLSPPVVKVFGSLTNFVINLIGDGAAQFLIIKFNYLKVSAVVGQKPSIDPNIDAVEFAGALSFVNKLKDLIPKGGSGSAGGVGFSFEFDVKPSGITAALTIGLPNVTVGVFSLQNMSFLMKVTIPFDGRPFAAYFAFCTKENPFRLTIMMFAGGGFFGIEVTPSGVRMLEAAFEFGGNFGFDCGVASGGASVMAGIYYKLETKNIGGEDVEQSELTGYFRLQGNLSILGLIRVNLLFELKLTWLSTGKVYGTATIEVEIEILFLSFSVGVTVERQLKGSDGDPTFKDMLPQPTLWLAYCESFA
jgi:hypothetical protein